MVYSYLNPGGQQLSSEYAPLPIVYFSFIFLWLPVLILWILNWIKHRDVSKNITLCKAICGKTVCSSLTKVSELHRKLCESVTLSCVKLISFGVFCCFEMKEIEILIWK